MAKLGPTVTHDVDNRAKITQAFDRVAYFLELQAPDGNTQYLYVSMGDFIDSLDKIGIPTAPSSARLQQNVASLNIYSNVRGIVTGTNLNGGNIEFWPDNYGPANGANVPNASGQVYDFGDQPGDPRDSYGSMHVHNHDAKQTLLSVNHWREGKGADLGISNQATGNAGNWPVKRSRV